MPRTLPDGDSTPEDELPLALRRRRALRETQAVLEQADALYAASSCPASGDCCQLAKTGRPPWLWPTEWDLIVERLAHDGRPMPAARDDGGCPLLDEAARRCTVYAARPLGCRTFFCARAQGPEQAAQDVGALLERLGALNVALDDCAAPRPLSELHRRGRP